MSLKFSTEKVTEGASSILIPDLGKVFGNVLARTSAPVFYNPRMRLNRDTSVLALVVHQKRLSRPFVICEPMCGTGVRGIRLALEVPGVEKAFLGDLNPNAVMLARENAALNGVSGKVEVRLMDANQLLSSHGGPSNRFDYIDIDPYGSPSPYLDSMARACRNNGMIALTATDMAPLCGVNLGACLRKYGGRPLRTKYCHETALRLVYGALVKAVALQKFTARPVFSYAVDHYVRIYAVLERGAIKAGRGLENMGFLLHCINCLNRRSVNFQELSHSGTCEVCGSKYKIGGPMWLGKIAETDFCEEMLSLSNATPLSSNLRLIRLIRRVQGEVDFEPTYYNIDLLCSRLGVASLPMNDVLSALKDTGFQAARTHFDDRGVKTDASIVELKNVLKVLK